MSYSRSYIKPSYITSYNTGKREWTKKRKTSYALSAGIISTKNNPKPLSNRRVAMLLAAVIQVNGDTGS